MIDSRAVVDSNAKIADDVEIGPFTVVGPDVEIAAGTWIGPNVVIKGPTRIGKNNKIYQFSSIGEDPQDLKYQGERTTLEIGDNNIIREYCTLNRGTMQGGGVTKLGNNNVLLAYVHIAHDCIVHDNTIFSNNASLAGHVEIFDYVVLGGFSAVYQFCRIGEHAFLASGAMIEKDVLPFVKAAASTDYYAKPFGLNSVGLKRRGFGPEERMALKRAYRIVYREGLSVQEAVEKLKEVSSEFPYANRYIEFLQTAKHGILR